LARHSRCSARGRTAELRSDAEKDRTRTDEDLPALCVHLEYPLRLRRRLRSTNLLERSLEEVKRRTKVIGAFPGETSCLSLCWAVLDLFIATARGLGLTALEHRQLAQMRAAATTRAPASRTA